MRVLVRDPEVLNTHHEFTRIIDPHQNGVGLHADTGRRSQVVYTDDTLLTLVRVVVIPNPAQDIHRRQGYGGEPAHELVLFGANATVIPRLIFDPENDRAREIIPGQR